MPKPNDVSFSETAAPVVQQPATGRPPVVLAKLNIEFRIVTAEIDRLLHEFDRLLRLPFLEMCPGNIGHDSVIVRQLRRRFGKTLARLTDGSALDGIESVT